MSPKQIIDISLVATPEVDASALTGLHGVLSSFGHMVPGPVTFKPRVVSPDAVWRNIKAPDQVIKNVMDMPLPLQSRLSEVKQTDVLLIPSLYLLTPEWPGNPYPDLTEWILRMHRQGTLICSACTGAMLLAETGLLDGYEATQHWAFERLFMNHFPKVRLNISKVLIATGADSRIIMSGASAAWHDLLIYLISRYAGPHAAQTCAKFFLLNTHSDGQAPYVIFQANSQHGDAIVQSAQQWLHENSRHPNPVEHVQTVSGISVRTFSRRFQKATGLSPINYVQRLRIENAKYLLETKGDAIDAISWKVGYEDPAFFRRLFKRLTGMTPGAYRRKFQPGEMI